MDFQEPGAAAAGRLAAMAVPLQDFAAPRRGNGVGAGGAGGVDLGIALDSLQVAGYQGLGTAPGLDGGGVAGRAMVHVNLVVRAGGKVPPGGRFLLQEGAQSGQEKVGPVAGGQTVLLVDLFDEGLITGQLFRA